MAPASTPVLDIQPPSLRRVLPEPARGFTLMEMLVVLAIIVLITTVAVAGQSRYNQTLLLTDTSYTVAFSFRQAQTFGISSRGFNGITNAGYGVDFTRATPGTYTIFVDSTRVLQTPSLCPIGTAGTPDAKPGNCLYDAGSDGVVRTMTFNRGFTISRFCLSAGGTKYCSDDATPLTSLDAVFIRPNTRTVLTAIRSGAPVDGTCAEVHLTAPGGLTERSIRVSSLGEVSIGQTCP